MTLIVIGGALVALLVFLILRQPDHFEVSRSIRIAASAEALFSIICDFRQWTHWSPWDERDPAMVKTYSGSPTGVGAIYEWSGNGQVGAGRNTIVSAEPHSQVEMRLEMVRPVRADNRVEFTLQEDGGETRVTWSMRGANTLLGRVINLVFSHERMVGGAFELGLARLKTYAEK